MKYDSSMVTGVILAGGRATRMGGNDKGLIELAGRPMIEYVVDSMKNQVSDLYINANRNEAAYQRCGYPVFNDSRDDFAGPLAGIATAMGRATTELLLVAPCDGPWLPQDLGERLYREMSLAGADVCMAHDAAACSRFMASSAAIWPPASSIFSTPVTARSSSGSISRDQP